MTQTSRTWIRAVAVFAVLTLMVAACSSTEDTEDAADTQTDDADTAAAEPTDEADPEDQAGDDGDSGGDDATEETASEDAAAASGDDQGADEGEITATPTADLCPDDGTTYVVGYDTFSESQEFAAARFDGLQMWEEELGCIEIIRAVDNADGATALANVRTFINREVDGVLLLQVVSDAQAGIVQELDEAGIPVMATDIAAPGAPFLSASDAEAGVQAGEALVAAHQDSGAEESPWVVLVKVPAAGEVVGQRMAEAERVITEQLDVPSEQVVSVEVTQQTSEEAFNATRQAQGVIPDDVPVLVTAVNDELALGAFQALDQADRGRTLTVVGIGGLSAGLQATCQFDQWAGTVDFDPFGQTGYIVSMMLRLMSGQDVPDEFFTPTEVIGPEQVAERYPEQCPA
ncbi:sugar ABC transporter substrate-binding protein [Euzebya tangerina]|uniref:sugar ABC transporter substrate-binding protein n=1 Tax=Euzebya tangerina TaxID=591198 RepID=UPI000E31347C|nr:sugar ABC transporter substrate-binding protein [Euzebya tangerina]